MPSRVRRKPMLLTILILSNFFLGILAAVAITYAVGCSKRTSEADKRRTEDISAIKETCEIVTTARVREAEQAASTRVDAEVRARSASQASKEMQVSLEKQEKHHEKLMEARIQAASEAAANRARQEVLASIHPEAKSYQREKSIVRKKYYAGVEERLLLGDLPITGWFRHEREVAERLNEKELKMVAEAMSIIIPLASSLPSVLSSLALMKKADPPLAQARETGGNIPPNSPIQ
jgi:hypothetical protein